MTVCLHHTPNVQASSLILGGSGLLRTDGTIQLGVRKLISEVRGLVYDNDWLPKVIEPTSIPVWLCRDAVDDPVELLVQYVKVGGQAGGQGPSWNRLHADTMDTACMLWLCAWLVMSAEL